MFNKIMILDHLYPEGFWYLRDERGKNTNNQKYRSHRTSIETWERLNMTKSTWNQFVDLSLKHWAAKICYKSRKVGQMSW